MSAIQSWFGPLGAERTLDEIRRPRSDVGGDGRARAARRAPGRPGPLGASAARRCSAPPRSLRGGAAATPCGRHRPSSCHRTRGGSRRTSSPSRSRRRHGRRDLGRVVRRRGELQRPADRLDPEPVAMRVDVGDYFLGWRSSSAPKKAAAALEDLIRATKLLVLTLELDDRGPWSPEARPAGCPRPSLRRRPTCATSRG